MALQKETLLKFTARRYKTAHTSEEDFHTFATRYHAGKAALIQVRHGILGVRHVLHTHHPLPPSLLTASQSFKPAALRALLTEGPLAAKKPPTWTVDDHDFEVVYYFRSIEQLGSFLEDPEFQEIQVEEANLADQERALLSIGWEEVYVEDGKVVNIENGESVYQGFGESVKKLAGGKGGE